MNKDILDLVKNNNRVILPNFGAFIVSSEKNGFSVLFNNFLSFNDGLLVNHIAASRSIDSTLALEQVNAFVDGLKNTLDTTGRYDIPGLGRFTKDTTGIIRFIQDSESLIQAEKIADSDELLDLMPPSEAADAPIITEKNDTTPSYTSNDSILNIDNEPDNTERNTTTPPPMTNVNTSNPTPEKTTVIIEKKKKSPRLLLWLLLLLLIAGAIYYFTAVNPILSNLFNKKTPAPPKVETPAPAPAPVVETPAPVVEETPVTTDNKYHIIVATLKNEQVAIEQVAKLKEKGFENAMILPRDNKFLVSIDAQPDLISADARQEEIVNKYRIESYVLTIK